jgi:D-sedoheptulose 7-phosphate isomerase
LRAGQLIMHDIKKHFLEAATVLQAFIENEQQMDQMQKAGDLLAEALQNGNKVITCGNGGSMCDAMHFAEELNGRFRNDRKPLPALAVSDPSYITCVANDYGYEEVFSRFIEAHGNKGDILVALSTSGNSPNIIRALKTAKSRNMNTISLTGKKGGKAAELSSIEIRAPYSEFADRAQEIHIKVIHTWIDYIEKKVL